jgi:hypothetical protein
MRKLYDKGILHTSGKHYHTAETVYESQEDDAQTKFYKARMHRSKTTATGRTPGSNSLRNFKSYMKSAKTQIDPECSV